MFVPDIDLITTSWRKSQSPSLSGQRSYKKRLTLTKSSESQSPSLSGQRSYNTRKRITTFPGVSIPFTIGSTFVRLNNDQLLYLCSLNPLHYRVNVRTLVFFTNAALQNSLNPLHYRVNVRTETAKNIEPNLEGLNPLHYRVNVRTTTTSSS